MILPLLFTISFTCGQPGRAIEVFPSGPALSVNTLRLSIRFAKVPSGAVLPQLSLSDEHGYALRDVFLQQELWSPDRKTLTVLFDPGRLKTGVGRHEASGSPLQGHSRVGLLLGGCLLKEWQVDRRRCRPVEPRLWQIETPRFGTRLPLLIKFAEALDIQAEHLIAVVNAAGQRVVGTEALAASETLWAFVPEHAWTKGGYRISLHPDLENVCGDEVGDSFEHSMSEKQAEESPLSFTIDAR